MLSQNGATNRTDTHVATPQSTSNTEQTRSDTSNTTATCTSNTQSPQIDSQTVHTRSNKTHFHTAVILNRAVFTPPIEPQTMNSHTQTRQARHTSPINRSLNAILKRPTLNDLAPQVGTMQRPQMSTEASHRYPQLAELYKRVTNTNQPNSVNAIQSLTHALNIHQWREQLKDYHDTTLTDHLEYGFPLGFVVKDIPQTTTVSKDTP